MNLNGLADRLCDQMDALMTAKAADSESFCLEVERSGAVANLARAIIETGRLNLDATKVAMELRGSERVSLPPMLVSGDA